MKRKSDRRGIALVWTALVLLSMILMVGMSLDGAIALLAIHQLQNAADAAALAGAQWVKIDANEAVERTYETAKANFAMHEDVDLEYAYAAGTFTNDMDIVLGQFFPQRRINNVQPWFVPTVINANAVKAIARRTTTSPDGPVGLIFGRIINIDTIDLSRYTIAMSDDTSGAGILVLSEDQEDAPALYLYGTGGLVCPDGEIQVNNPYDPAVLRNSTVTEDTIIGRQLNTCGQVGGKLEDDCPVPYVEDANRIPDPLADEPRPAPPFPDPCIVETVTADNHPSGELTPGYYPGGLFLSNGTWNLEPGVYLLGGAGLDIQGNTVFNAEYCQFFITKSLPDANGVVTWGKVNIAGSATIQISPPGDNPDNYVDGKPVVNGYMGVSLWQDDDNPQDALINGDGGDGDRIDGTVYFPNNELTALGNNFALGNQLICHVLNVGGTGSVQINYDGRNRGQAETSSCIVE